MIKVLSMVVLLLLTSCATIVSGSRYDVAIESQPSGADIVVRDKHGNTVHVGKTPATVALAADAGYFSRARYTVDASMNGYQARQGVMEAELNSWYWGNILWPGVLGLLVFDPLGGGMWELKDKLVIELTPATEAGRGRNPADEQTEKKTKGGA